jgi:excisionase family DNA binding protein
MGTNKDIMTPKMIAEESGLSLNYVYKKLKDGTIPHRKIGDLYLTTRKSFMDWLAVDNSQVVKSAA